MRYRFKIEIFYLVQVACIFAFFTTDAQAPIICTIAGTGRQVSSGDGGLADSASFSLPGEFAVDASGNLYISDAGANCVRKINALTGIISTVAGNGGQGHTGDGGLADSAELNNPGGITIDQSGNLIITDCANNCIRKVDAATQIISTIAGTGVPGYAGDGGPADSAEFYNPTSIAFDASGNLYISCQLNNNIRKIDAQTKTISTVAGKGTPGYSGDNGPADSAELFYPAGIACDANDNLFICDWHNSCVRKVNLATNIITTIAGIYSVNGGYSGDGGPADSANLRKPTDVFIDSLNNIYVTDWGNNVVREIATSTSIITTLAGNGTEGYSGDGGPADSAELNNPHGLALWQGGLLIADSWNRRVRKVSGLTSAMTSLESKYVFSVYPNPVKNILNIDIQTPISNSMHVAVMDITGQELVHLTINPFIKNELDVSALPPSMYFIQLHEAQQNLVRKFVKE